MTLQGTAGIITAAGTAAIEVYWNRRAQVQSILGLDSNHKPGAKNLRNNADTDQKPADLVLSDQDSDDTLNHKVDAIVATVMSTKRVQNEDRVRSGLREVAKNLRDLMNDSAYAYEAPWQISQFRVDISIQGTGTVATGVSAGGAVRLRFEWNRNTTRSVAAQNLGDSAEAKNLAQLFQTIGYDLEQTTKAQHGDAFELYAMQVGLGLYAKAKFGVVKGEIGALGLALFTRQKTSQSFTSESDTTISYIPYIQYKPRGPHLDYATNHNIAFDVESDHQGVIERAIFYVSREQFRTSLVKSAEHGFHIAERTSESNTDKWYVSELRPQFTLSIQGATPFVTIGGQAFLELRIRRTAQL